MKPSLQHFPMLTFLMIVIILKQTLILKISYFQDLKNTWIVYTNAYCIMHYFSELKEDLFLDITVLASRLGFQSSLIFLDKYVRDMTATLCFGFLISKMRERLESSSQDCWEGYKSYSNSHKNCNIESTYLEFLNAFFNIK